MLMAVVIYKGNVKGLSSIIRMTTTGIISALAITAGNGASHIFLILEVIIAAIKVAKVPKIISRIVPPIQFEIRHPSVTPQIASGIIKGSTVNASETLNWMLPNEIGAKASVSTV